MSMYDMMTGGPHPLAVLWLEILGIDPRSISRLRNVYIVFEDDKPRIYILTRECENQVLSDREDCIANRQSMPNDTYWEFEFKLPEYLEPEVIELKELVSLPRFAEHFHQMMKHLENEDKDDPVTQAMLERAKPVFEKLLEKIRSDENSIIEV